MCDVFRRLFARKQAKRGDAQDAADRERALRQAQLRERQEKLSLMLSIVPNTEKAAEHGSD